MMHALYPAVFQPVVDPADLSNLSMDKIKMNIIKMTLYNEEM